MIKIFSFILGCILGNTIGILLMCLLQVNKEKDTTINKQTKFYAKKENDKTVKDAIIKSKSHRKKLEERIEKMTSQNQFKEVL